MGHLTTRTIDLLLADAADAAARQHLAECPACDARFAAALREREAFLESNPPAVRAAQLLDEHARRARRPTPDPARWLRWFLPTTTLAAAGLIVLFLRPGGPRAPMVSAPEILDKGGPSVSQVRKGNAVQLSVTVAAPTDVHVFELASDGTFSPVLSERHEHAGPLSRSFVLDATPEDTLLLVTMDGFAELLRISKK